MRDVCRILIIKPSSLGDIVHALPTAAALRRRFPAAKLTWLVKREWAEVLDGNPDIDAVLAVDLSLGGWPTAIEKVRAGRFDLVVDLQGLLRSAVLGWLSGAPVRIGFANGREGSPWFYTDRVAVPSSSLHAVDRYLLVAKSLGLPADQLFPLVFPLPHDPVAEARVAALLTSEGIKTEAVLIAMNPSARWDTKQWSAASFASVADHLQREAGACVVMIGGRAERPRGEQVIRHMRSAPIDLVGKTTVKELIALLRRVGALITNDSGPMHLAAAVGTPVVALFGPTDPARTGPYGDGHTVLRSGVACSPCFSRRCTNPSLMECLTAIRPRQVVEAATKPINRGEPCQLTKNC